ncbi:hypothetical protein RO3G_17068 [Rhizopus delemar RA 99-880]|uniref:Uncharacterized protein n=1 Tax=Rhizopus delemar (strain RA 99-880 / ATCC MYA-4621 / FGSC 9543 / NRRL 43880) TaxID=246409 RepID=I1CUY1_RHIO9|nr:hypothetical protein RO3G_17068 [Rhizopus delemar RA 99-880]|eukprot:EIE92261.1 hypothetical protein RO3G_17068 [Rhizopus delemar RA 99-880]
MDNKRKDYLLFWEFLTELNNVILRVISIMWKISNIPDIGLGLVILVDTSSYQRTLMNTIHILKEHV